MNNIETIQRILKDAGLNARVENDVIYLEDPSCVTRGFENFLTYAWDVLFIITIFLIIGWAMSVIRNAKTEIRENIKSLVLIFGILSATGPILNIIFGGDLMGRACDVYPVSVSEINELLETQVGSTALDAKLYEDLDIYDSGPTELFEEE